MSVKILITGASGFIGAHLTSRLVHLGYEALGVDNFGDYYSPALKISRVKALGVEKVTRKLDLVDVASLEELLHQFTPTAVIHLAAQPGVRYARINPNSYIQSNVVAFENILQKSIEFGVRRFIYASSSSVYDSSIKSPFSEEVRGDSVKNLYALSKRFNEDRIRLLEDEIETIGLRFFSVYGPWGRPDMAYLRMIGNARGVYRFNMIGDGEQLRDYTYVDDVIDSIVSVLGLTNLPKVLNVGGGYPVSLNYMQNQINQFYDKRPDFDRMDRDETEATSTMASTSLARALDLPIPQTQIQDGIARVCKWAETISDQDLSHWLNSSR
jgi:UDP-glucuronate 4-epimerase